MMAQLCEYMKYHGTIRVPNVSFTVQEIMISQKASFDIDISKKKAMKNKFEKGETKFNV